MAERLSQAYLDAELGAEARDFDVRSAGVQAAVGSAMHLDSALVLRGLGGSPSDFRAQQFSGGMAIEADLVLTMTRQQRGLVLQAAPRALARTFTLLEAAGLAAMVGAATEVPDAPAPHRARELVAGWAAARWRWADGVDDDVSDPIGRPVEVHQQVGEVIAGALIPLLARLAGSRGDAAGGPAAGSPTRRVS